MINITDKIYRHDIEYINSIMLSLLFSPVIFSLLEDGLNLYNKSFANHSEESQEDHFDNQSKGKHFIEEEIEGINLINISVYLTYFLSDKKFTFFYNEKYFKLMKKLNETFLIDKKKGRKHLTSLLVSKLHKMKIMSENFSGFEDKVNFILPKDSTDFEILELKNIFDEQLNFLKKPLPICVSRNNIMKITNLIILLENSVSYTDRNNINGNKIIITSNNFSNFKKRTRISEALSGSNNIINEKEKKNKQSKNKRYKDKVGKLHSQMNNIIGGITEENEEENSNEQEEDNSISENNSEIMDDGEIDEDTNFRIQNKGFKSFIEELDPETNFYLYEKNKDITFSLSKNNPKIQIQKEKFYVVPIWFKKLFSESITKMKKCKICQSLLPDLLCDESSEILPEYENNRKHIGLYK